MTQAQQQLDRLVAIMARLRDPETGCDWDKQQTFTTIAPYTIEEAYEVADACERNDLAALKDELGDLLLQVIFHSRMAQEQGAFALADVIQSVCEKMERRHPHIFGEAEKSPGWEAIKAQERLEQANHGALDGVALGMPALLRAEKLQKRAARTGFDWPGPTGARSKIVEEMIEVDEDPCEEEVGDLLFATVNWVRLLGFDSEQALRKANAKFERRFRGMEAYAGDRFNSLSLDEKDALWDQVKRDEKATKAR